MPRGWSWLQSMRWKILAPLFLFAFVVTVPAFWVVTSLLKGQMREETSRRGELLVHAVANAAGTMMVTDNFRAFVERAGEETGVDLILVLQGEEGLIVGGTRPEWIGVKLRDLPEGAVAFRDSLRQVTREGRPYQSEANHRLEYIYPIEPIGAGTVVGQEVGAVVLQLDPSVGEAGILRIFRISGVIRLAVLVLALFGMMALLDRQVLRPISALLRTVRRQAAGDPTARVDLKRDDEIGELAVNLDRMLTALNEQTKAAERSAARFLTVFEHSTSGIVLLDAREIFDSNRAALQLLGCERKGLFLGNSWRRLAPEFQPDGRSSHDKIREMMDLAQKQGSCRTECVLKRQDDSALMADVTLTSIYVDGRDGFLLMFHDITAYKEAQAELRRSKAAVEQALRELSRHKYALDQHAMVAVTDGRGVITYANDLFCAHSGYRQHELLGQTHAILKSGRHPPEFYARMWSVIAGGEVWHGEICNRSKDGSLQWMQCTIVPFKDVDGRIDRYVAIRSDITERKQAEVAMREAKDAAEAADRAKSVFLATMSHEIRTPMNGVIGMAQLLARTPLTDEQQDYVNTIEACGSTLISLINDILDFSKIEAGKMELEALTFDVRQCVEETLDLAAPLAAEQGLELALIFDPQVPLAIVADVTRLRQVLFNLLSNAIKFTPQGEVVVRVWGEPDGQDEDHVRLYCSVADTGIGIPADRRDRLFRPFSQVDAGTARQYGGTGLGLAICHRIVHMMEGEIGVESEEGHGSTFTFHVRARRAPGFHPPVIDAQDLAALHWCILEPSAAQRESLRSILEPLGVPHVFRDALPDAPQEGEAWLVDAELAERSRCFVNSGVGGDNLPKLAILGTLQSPKYLPGRISMIHKPFKAGSLLSSLRRLAHEDGGSAVAGPLGQASATSVTRPGLRVLVADDNQVNQKVLTLMLRRQGCNVSVVSNGQEVLDRLEKDAFDVLLLDVQMPVLDGYQTAARLRADARWASLPVVAVTAGAMQGDREKAIEAGMDDYVPKPVTEQSLRRVLDRVMG